MTGSFITRFRELHDKAKVGALTPDARAEYQQSRTELGRLMLVAQQMSHGGKTLRSGLRIAQLIKVEIDLGGESPERTSTMDLASGGFAALLPTAQPIARNVRFDLAVPALSGSGTQSVKGTARVASCRAQGALHRVSFAFETMSSTDRELLDMAIIDFVLRRFVLPA